MGSCLSIAIVFVGSGYKNDPLTSFVRVINLPCVCDW